MKFAGAEKVDAGKLADHEANYGEEDALVGCIDSYDACHAMKTKHFYVAQVGSWNEQNRAVFGVDGEGLIG